MSTKTTTPNCRTTTELLPWLVNGSLLEDERQEVLRHLESCSSCRHEMAETSQSWHLMTCHVPSMALAEFAHGLPVSKFDRSRIEEHLIVCPSCRQEVEIIMSDNVVDFEPARTPRARSAKSAANAIRRVPTWRRLAIAASVAAFLGANGFLWSVVRSGPAAPRVNEPIQPSSVHKEALTVEANMSGIFIDSFESGGLSTWSDG